MGTIDARYIIAVGFALTAISLWQMTGFYLQMDSGSIVWSGLLQGFGTGFVYVPLAAIAFATLAPRAAQRRHRDVQPDAQPRQQHRHLGRDRRCSRATRRSCIRGSPSTSRPSATR